jgi:hypothetical protein
VLIASERLGSLDDFKERTTRKLDGVRCPDHNQPPRLSFLGSTLREVKVQLSACCEKLADIANQKIADR